MRVLLIPASWPTTYNPVRACFFVDQALALRKAGHEVAVLAVTHVSKEILNSRRMDFGFRRHLSNGILVHSFQYPAWPTWKWSYLLPKKLIGRRLYPAVEKEFGRPDVAHVHTYLGGDLALWLKSTRGIPFAATEHWVDFLNGALRPWQDQLARRVFTGANARFAVGEKLRAELERRYSLCFGLQSNTVDTDFFTPLEERHEKKQEMYTFLNISSRFEERKGQDLLIKAFALAFPNGQEKLILAGDGDKTLLMDFTRKLGVQNRILFFPRQSRSEVLNLMRQADCFVMPSRSETFGVVALEALCSGLPVVATRSGGPETTLHGLPGVVLCEPDSADIAKAMAAARAAQYDSKSIHNAAAARYSHAAVASELTRSYRAILDKP